jgi:hypothetical protein
MATVDCYGPYPVGLGFGDLFMPGEVRDFSWGPWPAFAGGAVSVTVHPHLFNSTASITLESVTRRDIRGGQIFVDCTYRNTGTGGLKGWHLYVSLVRP